MDNPVSQIDIAAWAVVSEPIDAAAVERVKENAKRLGQSANPVETDHDRQLQTRSVQNQERSPGRLVAWMIRGGVAAAIAGVVIATLLVPGNNSAAFAAALKKLELVKVYSFDQIIYSENLSEPAENHITVAEDGRQRSEGEGSVMITDKTGNIRLTLLQSAKTAIVGDAVAGAEGFDPLAWFRMLQSIDNETTVDLGEKEIDGVLAFGKEVHIDIYRLHVWVNAESEELVQVEHFFPADSPIEKAVTTDFNFDEEVDESAFSFEVPKGYTVYAPDVDIERLVSDPEQNVIELMRDHAELAEGRFPVSLSDWSEWLPVLTSDDGKPNMGLAQKLGAVFPFLTSVRSENYAYLGNGVSLDQGERVIVFWYRNEEGAFRAIYSDLTVEDIDRAELPK